ncbi:MAG: hypothetical protein ACT4PS_11015 [Betaproteobacteria bacterium]
MKGRPRNDVRSRIAHIAARLMAEDGIEDYALAKRKAARQAGLPDSRQLPDNYEIDEALKAYQEIYQHNEHRSRLRGLREKALSAMRLLRPFNPYLTGSVLNGNAGRYADIDLQLFTDNVKAVELYFIDRGIPYKAAQRRLYSGGEERTVPVFLLNDENVEIRVEVLASDDLRRPLRATPNGKLMERAKVEAVEALVSGAGTAASG